MQFKKITFTDDANTVNLQNELNETNPWILTINQTNKRVEASKSQRTADLILAIDLQKYTLHAQRLAFATQSVCLTFSKWKIKRART